MALNRLFLLLLMVFAVVATVGLGHASSVTINNQLKVESKAHANVQVQEEAKEQVFWDKEPIHQPSLVMLMPWR